MDFIVVVPWIGPRETIDGFLAHVEPDELRRFIFVDNSRDAGLRALNLEQHGARVLYVPENLGVNRAWNIALRERHEQTLGCSTSVRFLDGFKAFVREWERGCNAWGGLTSLGWHLISMGRALIDELGLMDENFYPAYFDDTDYCCRLKLANLHSGAGAESGNLPRIRCRVEAAGIALALKANCFHARFDMLLDYYRRKWGGDPGKETFTHPFNDPTKPLSYWEPVGLEEVRKRFGYAD